MSGYMRYNDNAPHRCEPGIVTIHPRRSEPVKVMAFASVGDEWVCGVCSAIYRLTERGWNATGCAVVTR